MRWRLSDRFDPVAASIADRRRRRSGRRPSSRSASLLAEMRRRWRPEDSTVARAGVDGEIRYLRLPNDTVVAIRRETLAEMLVSTLREMRSRPSRRAEVRLAVLRRCVNDDEYAVAVEMVEAFPDEVVPTVDELRAQITAAIDDAEDAAA